MNKILVEVSVGELLDKISILEIKQEKIKDPEKLKFINDEHSILKSQLEQNVKTDQKLEKLFQSLKEINSKLWVIEDDKRLCEKEKDFGEKFIKLSRDVHFLNDDQFCIDLAAKNMDSLVRILKPKGVITTQVGSQDKKPQQVDSWLNVFNHHFGNTKLSRVYIPSFDCSWNFSSSINH